MRLLSMAGLIMLTVTSDDDGDGDGSAVKVSSRMLILLPLMRLIKLIAIIVMSGSIRLLFN